MRGTRAGAVVAVLAALACSGGGSGSSAPEMHLSSSAASFAGAVGGDDPAPQAITVTNSGGGSLALASLQITYGAGNGWLAATISGSSAPYTITLAPRIAGLRAGSYTATVQISCVGPANGPQEIAVTLSMLGPPQPILEVTPAALAFEATAGGADPAAKPVAVGNGGPGTLAVPTVSVTYGDGGSGWLGTTMSGSAAPFTVSVQPHVASLGAGTYTAVVVVASDGAAGSPAPVEVTLQVVPSQTRSVNVAAVDTYHDVGATGATSTDVPQAITRIRALSGGGAVTAIPGAEAGQWTLTGVPAGPYVLEVDENGALSYFFTSADAIDIGRDFGGRPGVVAATAPTPVSLALSGLDPWDAANDALQLTSTGARLWTPHAATTIGASVTSCTAEPVDWDGLPLLAASDTLQVLQVRTVPTSAGDAYDRVVAAAAISPPALANGAAASISASLAPVTEAELVADWRTSQFAALYPAASAPACSLSVWAWNVSLDAPGILYADAGILHLLDLVTAPGGPSADRSYIGAQALGYGQVLPEGYAAFRLAGVSIDAPRLAPGATEPVPLRAQAVRGDPLAALPATPIVPVVGPVGSPRVGGLDATVPEAPVGTGPTLTWTAPAVGVASSYRVALFRLDVVSGATQAIEVTDFITAATGLVVPEGILEPGKWYVAEISAVASPGDAVETSPARRSMPFASASVVTERFGP